MEVQELPPEPPCEEQPTTVQHFYYTNTNNHTDNAQRSQGQKTGFQKGYQGRTYVLSHAQNNQFQNKKQHNSQEVAPATMIAPQDELKSLSMMMKNCCKDNRFRARR